MDNTKQALAMHMIVNKELFEELESALTCKICLEVLYDGVQCTNCDAKFCKTHLQAWKRRDQSCPYCRERCPDKPIDKGIAAIIDGLLVRCGEPECSAVVPYGSLHKHVLEAHKGGKGKSLFGEASLCKDCKIYETLAKEQTRILGQAKREVKVNSSRLSACRHHAQGQ